MFPIQDREWGQVFDYTWKDLDPHLWECFREALLASETMQEIQGVVTSFAPKFELIARTRAEMSGVKRKYSKFNLWSTTEMITGIVISDGSYMARMLEYLPYYEAKSKVFNEIFRVVDRELRSIETQQKIVERNVFIDTSIERLHLEERDLGIIVRDELDYRDRREQIVSRNTALFSQTTEQTIKDICAVYSNGQVEIYPDESTQGMFVIEFVGSLGIPSDVVGLKKTLDIIFPAHLGFEFKFRYVSWSMLGDRVWSGLEGKTWNEIRSERSAR